MMGARTIPAPRKDLHRWEFATLAQAERVAKALASTGCECKVGQEPGKPWHVEIQ